MITSNEIEQAPAAVCKPAPAKILVVEDEEDLRDLVVQVLESRGYKVVSASSGKQALEEWSRRERDFDLLLTDMVMPDGMTGCQLAERLRADAPNLRVIYSSGHNAGVPGTHLAHIDEKQFLGKPYRPSKLIEMVRGSLEGKL